MIDSKPELARYLLTKVKQKELAPELVMDYLKGMSSSSDDNIATEPMALIGMACRFPDADNLDQFWDNLASGHESIRALSESRLEDVRRVGGDKYTLMKAGFLEAVDTFDPAYFNIPPKTAKQMDPYHRLMLKVFIEAIEDAGYHRGQLQGQSVGVFVGNDHTHRLETSYLSFVEQKDFPALTGSWTGILASRLSYLLNLKGPAYVLDSSCSSALVALDSAIKAIRNGDCETALVGGINLLLIPGQFEGEIQSTDFKVRAFDYQAEGTAWGEGVAGVLVKPLSRAIADHDHIHGIIRGIAVNNDGTSNGLTSPSARAQQEVLQKAWDRSNIQPETISYIEMHGTGTSLGDPIEIKGVTGAFSKYTQKKQFCAIGSIKTNIGHTVGVSGLASLIKVLLAMREGELPPSLNFRQPNPMIDFCNSPVYVQDQLTKWLRGDTPRRAGVSSFSLSGTNCHVVVEEAPVDKRPSEKKGWYLLPLSARTEQLLYSNINRLLHHINRHKGLRWKDICYTASTGREQQKVRAAVVCDGIDGLAEALESLLLAFNEKNSEKLNTKLDDYYICYGQATKNRSDSTSSALEIKQARALENTLSMEENKQYRQHWEELSALFVQGVDIDFSRLFVKEDVWRCALPPQTFQTSRYWEEAYKERTLEYAATDSNTSKVEFSAQALRTRALESARQLKIEKESYGNTTIYAMWVWSELLGYPTIQEQDNFYSLGGDSITGLRIVQTLSMMLELDIPLSALLGSHDFKDFVLRLELLTSTQPQEISIAVENTTIKQASDDANSYPLTAAQNRMFLTHTMMPESVAYNVTGVWKIENSIALSEIEERLNILIERHDSLRTTFHMEGDAPVQRVHRKLKLELEKYWLQSSINVTKELQQAIRAFVRPFQLEKGPLIRAAYFNIEDQAYMAIDLHHIVTDGTSMGVLFADYRKLSQGQTLTPLPLTFAKASAALESEPNSAALAEHRQWWMNQFADDIPLLNLSISKPRPQLRDNKGSRVFYTVPKELLNQVKELGRGQGATLYMVLFAALHHLLTRMGAGNDIVIGTPVSGRPRLEFQHLVGMFVNTLPIRTKSEENESFTDFLSKVKSTVLQAFDHQIYPYEKLIADLNPERDPGRNPLFDVYFVLQNIDMGMSDAGTEVVNYDSGCAKFDLTVSARETAVGLVMEWEYAESLYDRDTISRLAKRYENLLFDIVTYPQHLLTDLNVMDEQERHLLLNEWNGNATPFPAEQGIVALFEEWVERKGQADALILDGKTMSYEQLNRLSNKIAAAIIEQGIKPNSAIGLLLNRSFHMVGAILGVLKAGCYYVPLDSELPVERLLMMSSDADLKLLITHEQLNRSILKDQLEHVKLLDLDYLDERLPDHNPNIPSAQLPAHILYTSGTTGTPKGTIIQQQGIIRLVCKTNYIELGSEDVVLQLANYSFDATTFDIFGALLNGATLVLLHKHEVTDPQLLKQRIREHNVSAMLITTALFNAVVSTLPDCFDSVRTVLFGGEAASVHHVKKAFERLGPGRLINLYGPTETTVVATYYAVNKTPDHGALPIGKPISNTNVYILNENMALQPIGVPGELFVGGPGLALGYLNLPNMTSERFVDDPFKPGQKLYRTGDLAAWGEDGMLRYFGRSDQQLKLRGYRIEPAEIEGRALELPTIKEAYAGFYKDDNGNDSLCLWVTPSDKSEQNEPLAVRQALFLKLPAYMVPAFVVLLDQLPLNKNGKVDKSKLPPPVRLNMGDQRLPHNEKEALLTQIWEQVLGLKGIGQGDNFFELGGDSIKVIQVVSRVQSAGYKMAMTDLFQYQSIEALSPQLKLSLKPAEQGEVVGPCLPGPIQSWFLNEDTTHNTIFNQSMLIQGVTLPEKNKLELALLQLCNHHDMLRLIVDSDGNMRLREQDEGTLVYVEEYGVATTEQEKNERILSLQKQVNLYNGPLIAVTGGTDEKQVSWLCMAIHHMAVDVVSWSIVLEDLFGLIQDVNLSLPPKSTSFTAWSSELHKWAKEGGPLDELAYWKRIATDAAQFPATMSQTITAQADMVLVRHWVDNKAGQALCGLANQVYHTETQHLILASLVKALEKWIQVEAVVINMEGHGRETFNDELDVSRTVGWFTSNFPVLLKAEHELGTAIKSVKEAVKSVPRRGFGYDVLRTLVPNVSMEDRELLDSLQPAISFNYLGVQQGTISEQIKLASLPAEVTVDKAFANRWTLDIIASQTDSAICLDIRYPKTKYSDTEIHQFLYLLDEACCQIAEHCALSKGTEKTASDFTVTPLGQDELNLIFDDLEIS